MTTQIAIRKLNQTPRLVLFKLDKATSDPEKYTDWQLRLDFDKARQMLLSDLRVQICQEFKLTTFKDLMYVDIDNDDITVRHQEGLQLAFIFSNSDQDVIFKILNPVFYKVQINPIKTIFLDLCEIESRQGLVSTTTTTTATASASTDAVMPDIKSELQKSVIEPRMLKLQLKNLNAQCQILPYTGDNCFNCMQLGHKFKDCSYRFCRRFANGTGCQYGDKCGLPHLSL